MYLNQRVKVLSLNFRPDDYQESSQPTNKKKAKNKAETPQNSQKAQKAQNSENILKNSAKEESECSISSVNANQEKKMNNSNLKSSKYSNKKPFEDAPLKPLLSFQGGNQKIHH